MTLLTDLTNMVAALVADVAREADEVTVAVDALKQAVAALDVAKNDPAVKTALDALTAAHASLTDATTRLKAGVDSAAASGGPVKG